jgi:hypothetical protein
MVGILHCPEGGCVVKEHEIACSCKCGSALVVIPTIIRRKLYSVTLDVRTVNKKWSGVVIEDPKVLDGLIEYLTTVRKGWEVS